MLGQLSSRAKTLKKNLTSLDQHPIGKAALTVIIFLDIFILISIFNGLSAQTAQLARPWQYVPQYCRDIVIGESWNKTNRMDRLARVVMQYHGNYYLRQQRRKNINMHPICEPIDKQFVAIEDDRSLVQSLRKYRNTQQEIDSVNAELKRSKSAYDTMLLEKTAGERKQLPDSSTLRSNIDEKTAYLNTLMEKERLLAASLEQDSKVQALFSFIDNITEQQRTQLERDIDKDAYWFPVKRLGLEMLFLLPLVLVFYLWNSYSIKRERPFQVLVSSHLLVIVFIPVLFKIINLVYNIIPKKLLQQFIELLQRFNLIAIWYYVFMGLGILAALALVYLFQKKLFSHAKLIEKRIAKGRCQECGKHLPAGATACPFCGFQQFRACPNCNQPTFVYGKYCRECGQEIDNP